MLELSKAYTKALEDERTMSSEQKVLKNVGKQVTEWREGSLLQTLSLSLSLSQDPKRHLEEKVEGVLTTNITQSLGAMLDTVVFS